MASAPLTPLPGSNAVSFDALFNGGHGHLLSPHLCAAALRNYNAWRRGSETIEQPDPVEIGVAIDAAVMLIENGETYAAQARRLAMELECLLLACNDEAAVATWWDSANEALEQYRGATDAMNRETEGVAT